MDCATLAVYVLLLLVVATYVYEAWTGDWTADQIVGMGIFLAGTVVGLVLDDVLTTDSAILPWVEPIGAGIMLVGLAVFNR